MIAILVRRLAVALGTMLGSLLLVFLIIRAVPGDPVVQLLGDYAASATPAQIREFRESLGLERSLPEQFGLYVVNLSRGDLGTSFRTQRPVLSEISDNIPSTLLLIAAGLSVAVAVGVPVGVYAATHRNRMGDYLSMAAATLALSSPSFWFALLLIYLLSYRLGLFPLFGAGQGGDIPRYLVLPAAVVGLTSAAFIARMTRSTMLEVLGQDYIRTATAKGLSPRVVVYTHGLRNAALPVVTILGLDIATLMSSAVVIEVVFARPGLGKLVVDAMSSRDYPMVQGAVVVFTFVVIIANALVDVLYSMLDPRLRTSS